MNKYIVSMARLLRCPHQKECKTCNCKLKKKLQKINYKPTTFDENFLDNYGYLNFKKNKKHTQKNN